MRHFASFLQSGIITIGLGLTGCGDRTPDAVGLKIDTGSSVIKILTKQGQVECARGLDSITPQMGSLVRHSNITERLGRIGPGDKLSMTKEKNSGDVIMRQGEAVIAIFRKDMPHTLTPFSGKYPDNFCDQK